MEQNQSGNKTLIIILFLIIGLLGGLSGYLFFKKGDLQIKVVEVEKKVVLESKKADAFKKQLEELTIKYDSLVQVYMGLKKELEAERNKVVVLMADYEALKRQNVYVNNDAELRGRYDALMRDYNRNVAMIKDLKSKNAELTAENFNKSKLLDETIIQSEKLKQENSKLIKVVDVAKRLKTFNVYSDGVKASGSREKSTSKARKVNRIRTCFTILDNQLADKQEKLIYLVIKDPKGKTFAQGYDKLTLMDGAEIQYSLKKNIFYDNKTMEVCMPFNIKLDEELLAGNYKVQIFCDGFQIGQTSFELR